MRNLHIFAFVCLISKTMHLSVNPEEHILEDSAIVIRVEHPNNNSAVALPTYLNYMSSGPCYSEVYIDGIAIHRAEHTTDNSFSIRIPLPKTLSSDMHTISIDILDSHGMLLDSAVKSHVFHVVDQHTDPDDYYPQVDLFVPYNPELSDEDKAKAVVKDGWLVIMHQNLEFTRIEPIDSCEDIGWTTRALPRRIYDAFQFFNELDVLEIRLNELRAVVHKFILVEATRTHSNRPKPLYFEQSKHRFADFRDQIIHVVVDDLPNSTDPWVLENYQRNAILRGLGRAHPNDLVVIADVDEIPASYVLDALRSCDGPTSPAWLYSRFFNFRFEWEFAGQWKHPQVVRYATIAPGAPGAVSPQKVRMGAMAPEHTKIESAGWHCSFFSDAEGVMQKVQAFTHQELNRPVRPPAPPASKTPHPRRCTRCPGAPRRRLGVAARLRAARAGGVGCVRGLRRPARRP